MPPHSRNHNKIFKTFSVSSADRLDATDSTGDFTVQLEIPENEDDLLVLCARATIPKSYFNLAKYNTFTLHEDIDQTLTLPLGNYSIRTLSSTLQTLLNDNSNVSATYTVSYSLITGKITITSTYASAITTNESEHWLSEMLGLEPSTRTSTPITSTKICVFNAHQNITVHSDIVRGQKSDILTHIHVGHVLAYDYINYQYTESKIDNEILQPRRGNVYRFYLTNDLGDVLDLNGLDWTMDLKVYDDHRRLNHEFLHKSIEWIDFNIERFVDEFERVASEKSNKKKE